MTKSPDPSSASNFQEVLVKHLHLDLNVDFTTSRIDGVATAAVEIEFQAQEVVLDIFMLEIRKVSLIVSSAEENGHGKEKDVPIDYTITPFAAYGDALHISLPADRERGAKYLLKIEYVTDPESAAICWMDPAQTAGKEKSYLFTQGQSVLNRAFFPCQDSCAVRITYTADVKVPKGYTALMSAARLSEYPGGEKDGAEDSDGRESKSKALYRFEMKYSIPPYLVALVVGDLVSAPIGPRSKVWTEPCFLNPCVNEFQGITEKYLSVAEELYGPYLWENYDICIMPPGFPFGGMENPRMTFLTPCLVTGDGTLTDTCAHEIVHSWFGNLVTNSGWTDFFLNEGFTQYAQRRITTLVHGEAYTHLEALCGWERFLDDIRNFGPTSNLTKLRVPLGPGDDPEDVYNDVPYEKGYALVCYLRSLVESDDVFDSWMKTYVRDFQFKSIAAEEMFDHYLSHFPHLAQAGIANRPGFEFYEAWLDSPGLPPFVPGHSSARAPIRAAQKLVGQLVALLASPDDVTAIVEMYLQDNGNAIKGWQTYQVTYFLDECQKQNFSSPAGRHVLGSIVGKAFGVATSHNAEVSFRWSLLVTQNSMVEELPSVERFLKSQGKQKYTVAIYRSLHKNDGGGNVQTKAQFQAFAERVYNETKRQLHANVRKYVAKALEE